MRMATFISHFRVTALLVAGLTLLGPAADVDNSLLVELARNPQVASIRVDHPGFPLARTVASGVFESYRTDPLAQAARRAAEAAEAEDDIVWSTGGDDNIVWSTGHVDQVLWSVAQPVDTRRRASGVH